METIILAIIGGGIFGALASLIIAWWNKSKVNADTKKVESEIAKTDQDIITKWVDKYEELYARLEAERKAREDEKRGEFASREKERQSNDARYKELEDKFDAYKKTSEYNASIMISQISTLKNELEKSNRENVEFRKQLKLHDGQLNNLTQKVTGKLTPR